MMRFWFGALPRAATFAAAVMIGHAAMAQPAPSAGAPTSGQAPGPAGSALRPPPPMPTEQQIAAEVDARIALLKAQLRLTDAQLAYWPAFERALRDARIARAGEMIAQQRQNWTEREALRERMRHWREERRRGDAVARNPSSVSDIDLMRRQADMLTARASAMRSIADAAAPLHAALDDSQRGRLMRGIRNVGEQGAWRGGGGRWGRDTDD